MSHVREAGEAFAKPTEEPSTKNSTLCKLAPGLTDALATSVAVPLNVDPGAGLTQEMVGVASNTRCNPNVQYSSYAVHQGAMFSDTFNRTTGLGAGWQIWYGAYTTDGTSTVSGTPPINGNWASVTTPLTTADYAIQADLVVPAGSLNSGLAVRSAVSNAFDSDLYATKISTDGTVNLYRRNSWNWTLLASVNAGITAGTKYTLKLSATGTNPVHLQVSLDGVLQLSYDDSSLSRLTTGAVGIENYDPNVIYSKLCVLKQ